ncbi:SLATT domain-containing protein [Rhizobium ruizarguesonis]|uniref:SLATT domain-containing protein n=1 Tax=Rhizobium ruizarguesonis TaxID=2081791 RepID=UPI00103204A4|nr:SLATT domain-containing protein [Rhizobium ruizarguesonis]TBY56751.1 SLATT domain-containing protein [Rhizobium leguminosarum bv. viciae]TAW57718.1 SLATT domain-containing protein [Rhizobium ruizarguesonis]TBC79237.1 SLATT domain-containing protein [Rhizobium ruizarguesonis]TBC84396.1 SLATT domain-containing protein [Rhizobium ruizarguesonis]TBD48410.1 SLATT domain-containing protein [Rhizobium ruizarguesonis]
MVQPSQIEPEHYALESQIRECYGRCAYTHKTHEKMAERLHSRHKKGKWANIVLSSLITGGAVSAIFAKGAAWEGYAGYATVVLSILSLILNAYLKDLDPGALAQRHREAASDIWNVREAYLSLIADIVGQSSDLPALRQRRDSLQAALYKIYHSAPHTDGKAYSNAQDALKYNEDLTFSEGEIDVMLPSSLRRQARPLKSSEI